MYPVCVKRFCKNPLFMAQVRHRQTERRTDRHTDRLTNGQTARRAYGRISDLRSGLYYVTLAKNQSLIKWLDESANFDNLCSQPAVVKYTKKKK